MSQSDLFLLMVLLMRRASAPSVFVRCVRRFLRSIACV